MADKIRKGAGIFFVCTEDNTALLIRRSPEVSEPGTWGISGGNLKEGESFARGAIRETYEELGSIPRGRIVEVRKNTGESWKFAIFVADISWKQKKVWSAKIRLNHESDQFKWFRLNDFPPNLHSAISVIKT